MPIDTDLDQATDRELLTAVVVELRLLRRLIGAIFIIGVLMLFALPVVGAISSR